MISGVASIQFSFCSRYQFVRMLGINWTRSLALEVKEAGWLKICFKVSSKCLKKLTAKS